MAKLSNRILRRLILKNRYFLKMAPARTPEKFAKINMTFTGNNVLDQFAANSAAIFKNFNSNTSVLIKVNINSAFDYPASTSMEALKSIINSLRNAGVKTICVADCTALGRLPSKVIIEKKGLAELKKDGIKLRSFDYGPWRKVNINAPYFQHIILPKAIYKYDRIINLSNLKTHRFAGFTSAAKNLVGFMHPFQRYELHRTNLEERIAEIPLAVIPDLNIIDARKVFISGGPDHGEVQDANTIIVDSNIVSADIAAYNLLVETQQSSGAESLGRDYKRNPVLKALIRNMGYAK